MPLTLSRSRRRRDLRARIFPEPWRRIISRNVAVFGRLTHQDQGELCGHAAVLLDEKHYEGAGGIRMNDEIRLTIAAQAALLLLHRDTDYFPQLTTVLVYPGGYRANETRHVGGGIWSEGEEDRYGHTAPDLRAMVLAWDAVLDGAADPADGVNLVLHEFAHQLDFENRSTDGTPVFDSPDAWHDWSQVMAAELERLRRAQQSGEPTLLDYYGATDPAEFFAVATENFFERPRALRAGHPRLYEQLLRYYRQDPVTYSSETDAVRFMS